jgi:hypothetical protein
LLHDTRALARQPLLTVREVEAVFEWADVLSREIRWVRAEEAIVYARLSGPSALSLLGLFIDRSSPSSTTKAQRNLSPLWIDTVNVGAYFTWRQARASRQLGISFVVFGKECHGKIDSSTIVDCTVKRFSWRTSP